MSPERTEAHSENFLTYLKKTLYNLSFIKNFRDSNSSVQKLFLSSQTSGIGLVVCALGLAKNIAWLCLVPSFLGEKGPRIAKNALICFRFSR